MIIGLLLAATAAPQFYGNHDQEIRNEIQATYDGYAKAVLAHDVDKTMSFLTSDIVWVYPDGKQQHSAEIRESLKSWEDSIKPGTKINFTIDRLQIDSDEKIQAYVTMHYQAPAATSAFVSVRTSKWHDTWVKSHNRWQNSRGEQLASKKKK